MNKMQITTPSQASVCKWSLSALNTRKPPWNEVTQRMKLTGEQTAARTSGQVGRKSKAGMGRRAQRWRLFGEQLRVTRSCLWSRCLLFLCFFWSLYQQMKVILIVAGAHVPVCSSAIWCRAEPYKAAPNLDFLSQTAAWWGWNGNESKSIKAALKSNDPNLTRGFKNILSGGFRREKFGATLTAWHQLVKLRILPIFNWNQEIERKQKLCSKTVSVCLRENFFLNSYIFSLSWDF